MHVYAPISTMLPPLHQYPRKCAQPMLLHCLESLRVSWQTTKEIFGCVAPKFPEMTI